MAMANEVEGSSTLRGEEASTDDVEPSEAEETEVSDVPSDDPRDAKVLERVQEKLKKQLLDRKQELDERLYEQKKNLKKATKDREEAGVQLYDLQCNLAGLHLNLHKASTELATASEAHTKTREEMALMKKHHDARSAEHKALEVKTTTTRLELDNLQNTLKQVEKFTAKIKGEIQLNKRATYAGEEAVVKAERMKKEQDIIIDALQQNIKRLNEKNSLTKAQLEAQQRETKVAHVALLEADVEMDAINSEKKQITFQWKSTLIVLGRCDLALQSLYEAIHAQKEQLISIEGEKNNYGKIIAVEVEKAERQGINLMKIDSAMKEVAKHIARMTKKRAKMLTEYAKILVKLDAIEVEIGKVKAELATMEDEIKLTNKAFLRETAKVHELENKVLTGLLEQVTLEQTSAQATIASTIEMRKLVKKEDTMATEINYDLSRIRVDLLAVMSYNQSVTAALKAVNDDVNEKFAHIAKLEAETKRRHQEVEMKTKEIDRLNKQYDKLTSGMTDKAATPWEAMINSLKSEIDIKMKASSELQKQWLTLQTSLVALQNENNNLTERAQQDNAQQVVLVKRKQRVDGQFESLSKAIKELNMGIRVKQNLIIRLNDLIGKNASLEQALSKENAYLQLDHYIALKDLAKETMEMQVQLDEHRNEKEYALKHIDELEHHVMLWKYKITFEIQTQAAIDPSVGQAAMTAMKKEVDRMQLQLDGLLTQRKKLIAGLESRVDNRKAISIKIEAMSQRKGIDGPAGFEAGLVKTTAELKKAIRDTDKSAIELDKRLVELEEQRATLVAKATEMDEKVAAIVSQQEDCRVRLREATNARARALLATAMYQRLAKRHEDIKNNKWRGVAVKKTLDEDIKDAQTRCNNMLKLINALMMELPALQNKLDIMIIQMELALKAPH